MNDLTKCIFCKQPATFICPYDGMPLCGACAREEHEWRAWRIEFTHLTEAGAATADRMIGAALAPVEEATA